MKYAFLGAGKMTMALVHGMLRAKVCSADQILIASRTAAHVESLVQATSVRSAPSNAEAVAQADVVVLCVKPQDAETALQAARPEFAGKLLISVAAGLTASKLAAAAGTSRVIRAMPNTAALVGESATAVAVSEGVTAEDAEIAERMFSAVGRVFSVTESQLDAVTGVSGSGPAYLYLVIEALSDGGVSCGLPRKLALDLAIQTVAGAAAMAASTSEHPAVLREMVTSPGGTTIAALNVLEAAAVRSAFVQAVRAAKERSRELSGS